MEKEIGLFDVLASDSRMWVIHHNDLDGRCSAAIVRHATVEEPGRVIIFIECDYGNYNNKIPYEAIQPEDQVVIVDFSLQPPDMQRVIDTGAYIIWIDHHATAAEYPYQQLRGLRDFADKAWSGCELTWRYFFSGVPVPRVVELIGDYDKWLLAYGEESFDCYEGMKLMPTDPTGDFWQKLFDEKAESDLKMVLLVGTTARKYRDNYCNRMCESYGYVVQLPLADDPAPDAVKMVTGWATNIYAFGSQGFGRRFKDYMFCAAYIHNGENYTVSLYSEVIDVSAIAKFYGGGGHKGAAGFVCKKLPWLLPQGDVK